MILSLRRRHRVTIIALSVSLPIALVAGLTSRRAIPRQIASAGRVTQRSVNDDPLLWERSDLWPGMTFRTRLFAQTTDTAAVSVEISANEHWLQADVLVYWVPAETKTDQRVPDDARLLGAYPSNTGTRLNLPPEAARESGSLLLYSLANHEALARSKPFTARPNH